MIWCFLETKKHITELKFRIAFQTIEAQRISCENVVYLKDMLDHLKPIQDRQKNTTHPTEQKTKHIKKRTRLCGSLR